MFELDSRELARSSTIFVWYAFAGVVAVGHGLQRASGEPVRLCRQRPKDRRPQVGARDP